MKVAIVHYWFLTPGGGEKVTEFLAMLFPGADIFCLFADQDGLLPRESPKPRFMPLS